MKNRIRMGTVLTLALFMAVSLSAGTAFADNDKKGKGHHDDVITIVGPAGPQGPIGLTGATGATGPQGPIGLTGAVGATGPAGPQGPTGLTGPQGPAGADGAVGATGAQGPIGLTGATGPQGPIGLTGPQGPAGADGAVGATGAQGPIGLTGAAGTNGTNGVDGAVGATGAQGPIGLTGATGPQGQVGANGFDGAPGAQGPAGPQGAAGPVGPSGVIDPAALNAAICGLYDAAGAARPGICPYAVGDTGPGGGTVFYVDAKGTHGEEYGPELGPAPWGCAPLNIPAVFFASNNTTNIDGAANTAAIMAACADPGIAARLADAYVSPNGTTGWFLPSVLEGNRMIATRLQTGVRVDHGYLLSNQYGPSYVYGVGNNGVGTFNQYAPALLVPVHSF